MRLARRTLLDAREGAWVTTVALECGFSHPGRFAVEYKRRLNPGAHLQRFALAQELPLHSDPVLSDGRRMRWSLFAA